jgi:hypothetical protein
MVPASIIRLLNRLRWRDRSQALALALACAIGLLLASAVVAGLLDWLVDRWVDPPWFVWHIQAALLIGAVGIGLALVVVALLRRHSDDDLALWIEQKTPSLGQRLIAAVQLNRRGAKTRGMSSDLIAAVTRQAERDSQGVNLTDVCDNSRLKKAACVAIPALAIVAFLFLIAPDTCAALASRLMGNNVAIPRSVSLEPEGRDVWVAGEEGTLRVLASQAAGEKSSGYALITPEIGPSFRVRLTYESDGNDGVIYSGKVPPSDVPFTFRAWLADGRLRHPAAIRYAPRPVATSIQSWVVLPKKVLGTRQNGTPYEESMKGGDLFYRLDDSEGRIVVTAQTELAKAWIEITNKDEGIVPRVERLTLTNGTTATGTFALQPGDSSYEVHLTDTNGFECIDVPRRAIRKLPLEPPEVALLAETKWKKGDKGSPEDHEVEGIPILRTENPKVGRRFALEYRCEARYGLSHARIRFRVIPAGKDLDANAGKIDRDDFLVLPIGPPRDKSQKVTKEALREFSTQPPRDSSIPDTEGGGQYDFSIDGIPDGKGGYVQMKEGDRIQFYVEVFGKADPSGRPGRSVIREKEVVGLNALLIWLEKKDDLKERTRFLEEQQRNVKPGE